MLGVDGRRGKLEGRGRLLDEKALLVWLDKTHTGGSNAWVAERVGAGHPSSVSKAVRRVTKDSRLLRRSRDLEKELIN